MRMPAPKKAPMVNLLIAAGSVFQLAETDTKELRGNIQKKMGMKSGDRVQAIDLVDGEVLLLNCAVLPYAIVVADKRPHDAKHPSAGALTGHPGGASPI
jgi:hypothetical protein